MLTTVVAVIIAIVIAVPLTVVILNTYYKKSSKEKVGGAEIQARLKEGYNKRKIILIEK